LPDVEQCGGCGEDDWTEDDAEWSEDGDASEDGYEDDGGVGAQVGAYEDGIKDVVDRADDETAPGGEEGGLTPVAVEAEVDGDRPPDKEGSKGRNHGERGEGDRPEDDTGDAESPEGESGENTLYERDDEATKEGGVDGVVDSIEEFGGLVLA